MVLHKLGEDIMTEDKFYKLLILFRSFTPCTYNSLIRRDGITDDLINEALKNRLIEVHDIKDGEIRYVITDEGKKHW